LKICASSAHYQAVGNVNASFSIDFFLIYPTKAANTPVTLTIPLNCHVTIGAALGLVNLKLRRRK
jgi:hypothetical protein